LWLEAARVGEGRAPPTPREPRAFFWLGGFGGSGTVFSAGGLGGLSSFGDSLPTGALFAEESRLMSRGTLHRGSQITQVSMRKNTHDKYTFLINGLGSSVKDLMEESKQEPWVGSLILIPLKDLPVVFLAFSEE
jgi:hypothetical protein